MGKLADDFLMFLFEKHKKTGKNEFIIDDYMDFDGHKDAIIELSNQGIITKTNDILGRIVVHPIENEES